MTVEQLNSIWYDIVSNHYEISRKAWLAIDAMGDAPDTEKEYMEALIDIATALINK